MGSSIDSAVVDRVLAGAVASGAVPNVVAIAADADGVVYEGGAGPLEVGGSDTVDGGTHYRIMSMTKIITTTAALQLVEAGKLDLDAPVEEYLPEWAKREVLVGFDGDTPKLRAPATRATVKHLVTHTSGLHYPFFDANIIRWEQATGAPSLISGQAGVLDAPLVHDPGERFSYGLNTDILGKIVEALTGQTLDVVFAERILGPLGMRDTAFRPADSWRAGVTPVHVPAPPSDDAVGGWVSVGEILPPEPDWWPGGHGLYSTPRDYIRFQRALLRGGELDGERILSEATVDAAFTNQIGDLDFPAEIPSADPTLSADFVAGPGWKWGLGLLLNTVDLPGMRRAGSGSWAGLCNTHFWIDRTSGIAASIYSNTLPFAEPRAFQLYQAFEQALYASR